MDVPNNVPRVRIPRASESPARHMSAHMLRAVFRASHRFNSRAVGTVSQRQFSDGAVLTSALSVLFHRTDLTAALSVSFHRTDFTAALSVSFHRTDFAAASLRRAVLPHRFSDGANLTAALSALFHRAAACATPFWQQPLLPFPRLFLCQVRKSRTVLPERPNVRKRRACLL